MAAAKGRNVVLVLQHKHHPEGEQKVHLMWALLAWLRAPEFAEDHRNYCNGSEVVLIS